MKVLRVIFLGCLIFAMAGTAFAKNDKDKGDKGWGWGGEDGKGKWGQTYKAPEIDFDGPLKYGLLAIAGCSVVLLERSRRRRRALVK